VSFLVLLSLSLSAHATAPAAVDLSRYPAQATVAPEACASCTPAQRQGQGVLRIPVPPALRSAADPPDGSDLALLDAAGQPLAVAVARGAGRTDSFGLPVRPTQDADTWLIDDHDRPLDALDVDLRGRIWVASVSVDGWTGRDWVPLVPPRLLWSTGDAEHHRLVLPRGTRGPLRLHLDRHLAERLRAPQVDGVLWVGVHVDPLEEVLPVQQAVLQENGWTRYTVELPRSLPVRAVRLDARDPVFERRVQARLVDEVEAEQQPDAPVVVRRVLLGGATLDDVTVPVSGGPADRLVLLVDSAGQLPLSLPEVTVIFDGEELLVAGPGPGPLRLLGGADPHTTAVGDLQIALPELLRMASPPLSPGPVEDNPAWSPPELRARLAEPSTQIGLRGLTAVADVTGPAGLVRLNLPDAVVADARADLGDLRLVDGAGRQIPYLLRRRPLDRDLGPLDPARVEDGQTSRLTVALPLAGQHDDGPPVETVSLHTDATLFSRTVTVSRPRGPVLEPLRSVLWEGADRPSTLPIYVGRPVGRQLVVSIDNGDDPPLPVDGITVTEPTWDMVAWLPEGGARLLWGDPDRAPPDYDLALLREDLVHRATTEASLGPARSLDPAPASPWERGLVLAGLSALAAGLVGLVLGLVRAVPPPEEGDGEGGAAAAGEGTADAAGADRAES